MFLNHDYDIAKVVLLQQSWLFSFFFFFNAPLGNEDKVQQDKSQL
mgnify:FL=1